ncbi:DUF6463 family protein [Nocardia beijingensis]|uniref:DUF6463 family protein n=2 Tax=Nocardia beijingensis TaxID=95162 RepID=A0ABW7WRA4_9NOCA
MSDGKHLLRWAGGIMLVLGAGHLIVLTLASWRDITYWVEHGIWAAVPLDMGDGESAQTAESLQNKLTFWAGPGSFAVPLILLGLLIWQHAGRGTAVPAWIGWGLAVWCLLGGILLVPSPFLVGTISGVLVVIAARKDGRHAGVGASSAVTQN